VRRTFTAPIDLAARHIDRRSYSVIGRPSISTARRPAPFPQLVPAHFLAFMGDEATVSLPL